MPADLQHVSGFLRWWKEPYGAPADHAVIFYDRGLPEEWRRLVICKEMLHLLDNHRETAQSRDEVVRLIAEICAPWGLAASIPGISDQLGVLTALLVLLPRDALFVLRDHVRAGRMNAEAVAKLARIPETYAEFLLSPTWEEIVEKIGMSPRP